jgi:hypothetical protein
VIGVLAIGTPESEAFRLAAVRKGLDEVGYPASAHLVVEYAEVLSASTSRGINAAFANLARQRPDALFVGGDAFFNSRCIQLVNLALHHALPATYADRLLPEAGGLMTIAAMGGCCSWPPASATHDARPFWIRT